MILPPERTSDGTAGPKADISQDISYADSARSSAGRRLIRTVENATGRLRLIRRARGYQDEVAQGRDFWQVMVERYGLRFDIYRGSLGLVPRSGLLVVVANHPFGILDGLALGHLLARTRGDFRVLAHKVFRRAAELDKVILPVSFDETPEAIAITVQTRRVALDYLAQGGCVGVFPGGTVSTAARPMGRPMDPIWRGFAARMIARSGATVVPVYFDGHNSRLFQLASHLHYTLRMALLMAEFRRRTDSVLRMAIGQPIDANELVSFRGNNRELTEFLRQKTYGLSDRPIDAAELGHEFETRYI